MGSMLQCQFLGLLATEELGSLTKTLPITSLRQTMCRPSFYPAACELNARSSDNLLHSLTNDINNSSRQLGLFVDSQEHKKTYVRHHYHDYSTYPVVDYSLLHHGGGSANFAVKLYHLLEDADTEGFTNIISWQPHGRAFRIHHPQRFASEIMPRYFGNIRFSSFLRQVSLYGFLRLYQKTDDHDAYYQELFLRGRIDLCKKIRRQCVKGHGKRQSACPEQEPNLYALPPVDNGAAMVRSVTSDYFQVPAPMSVTPSRSPAPRNANFDEFDLEPLPIDHPSVVPLPELAAFLRGYLNCKPYEYSQQIIPQPSCEQSSAHGRVHMFSSSGSLRAAYAV